MTENEHEADEHIYRYTDGSDEDLDKQDADLEAALEESEEHIAEKKEEWSGPEKEHFHTKGGGDEPPPGSPEHDRGIISGA